MLPIGPRCILGWASLLVHFFLAATLVGYSAAQIGRPKAKQRLDLSRPPLPGSLNMTRARRILVAGLPLSGASLFAASLLQVHHSVGVTDVDPNLPCPRADDFKDVHRGFFIVLRVTPNDRHTLSDYVECFKPDVKYTVVRHPAQQLAALGVQVPGDSFSRSLKNQERSVQFKAVVDEVIMFEALFFARHTVAKKLEATGLAAHEIAHIWEGERTPHDISGFNMLFCKWCHHAEVVRNFKGRPHLSAATSSGGGSTMKPKGPVSVLPFGALKREAVPVLTTLHWDEAVFRDLEPSMEQRRVATNLCPKLSAMYRVKFPELGYAGAANKWGEIMPRFGDLLAAKQKRGVVFLVGALGAAWREVVLNWMVAAHRVRIYNYILLPTDADLHALLLRIHAPSFLPPDPEWAASQEPVYRWKLVQEALHRGVSVVYSDPTAVLLRNPLDLLARSRSHVVAGELRPPNGQIEEASPTKKQFGIFGATKKLMDASTVENGRIDPSFVFLRASNHLMAVIPKVVANVRPLDAASPARAFGHIFNGGPGGFVSWNEQPLRDPHLHSEQRVVDGTTPNGLRLTLWQDATLRKFGCGLKSPLNGVTILNCAFSSFSFGERLEGASEPKVVESGLRALGAWLLVPNWPQVKAQTTLEQWLALTLASSAQVKSGVVCRAGQGDLC